LAILHKFAYHNSYKTKDNFPHIDEILELRYDPLKYIRESKSSVVKLK
jgi:hypothetical protein